MEDLQEALAEYAASRPQPPARLSFEEFLEWCDEDTWAEWVDGEVRYHPETPDKQGVFRSAALSGFWVKTDWLWQDPLPSESTVLREMGVL